MPLPQAWIDLFERRLQRPVVGVVHRACGSSSVYFGPFENIDALHAFEAEHGVQLLAITLVDPESPQSEWWVL